MEEAGFEPRHPASGTALQLLPGLKDIEINLSFIQQMFIGHLLCDRSVIDTEGNKIDRVPPLKCISKCETHTSST